MKKTTKTGLAVVVLLLVLGMISACIGNYFVNLALVRPKKGAVKDIVPEAVTTNKTQQEIAKNREKIEEHTEKWLQDAKQETASIVSDDGLNLKAVKYYTAEKSSKWAFLVHGYCGRGSDMRNVAAYYLEQGYNVFMPDMRAHGESEGTYIGMGWLDKADVLKWLDTILAEDADAKIILHGISMGGATVMMVSGEKLPEQVKAIVEDCGYTSVWDIFSDELDALFGLPSFPILDICRIVGNIRAGYDMKEASAIDQVKKSETPILFIHGSEDNFVRTEMVYEVYEAARCEKELLVVDGAGHGEAYSLEPDLYFDTVFSFLDTYLTE